MTGDARPLAAIERLRDLARRRTWLALLAFSFVSTCILAVVAGLPTVYRATATILVEPRQGLEAAVPEEVESRLHLMTEQIQSRSRLLDLNERYHVYTRLEQAGLSEDELLLRMRRDIRLELKGPSQSNGKIVTAFTLSFLGRDPETVSQVANSLAGMYVEDDQRMRAGNVDALSSQLAEVRKQLEEQEQRLGDFREKHPGELPEQTASNMAALLRLDAQLRSASEARMRALDRRATLVRQVAGEAGSGGSGPRERLAKLREQLEEMRRTYTDKYPDVVRLQAEIRVVEQELAEAPKEARGERESTSSSTADELREVDAEIKTLKEEEQRLRGEAQQYHQRMEAAPIRGRAYEETARDYDTTKGLYNVLLKHYEEAQLATPQSAGQGGQRLRLLEPAVPPKDPVAPNRPQLALIGLVLAVAVSAGAVALAEKADSSFHSVEELRSFTRVPVVATIPRIVGPRGVARRRRLQALLATASLLSLILVANASYRFARGNDVLVSLLTRVR